MVIITEILLFSPAWLDRLIPHIDIEGDSALPDPEFEPVDHDGEAPIAQEPVLV